MTRIAVLQMTTGIDPVRNAQSLVEAVGDAARDGAEMLFTPEMSGLLDRDRDAEKFLQRTRQRANQAVGIAAHCPGNDECDLPTRIRCAAGTRQRQQCSHTAR